MQYFVCTSPIFSQDLKLKFNDRSSVTFNETILNWDCDAFSCAIDKSDVKLMHLDESNRNYRSKTVSFLSIKEQFASDPSNQCGNIQSYLRGRSKQITYFIVDNEDVLHVKVYQKSFCIVLNSNDQ